MSSWMDPHLPDGGDDDPAEVCPCCGGDPRTVCSECHTHSCWAGIFMCDNAQPAGTYQREAGTTKERRQ